MRPAIFSPRVTILDCGASRTIFAVIGGGAKRRLRLEQFALAHHAVESGYEGNWLLKTTDALTALRSQVKLAGPVTVILPPHLTLMKMLSTPRVAASKRDKIINFEGQQSIPYPLSEVVWDRLIAGENSHSFNILLCAAKLDVLDPLSAAITAAGMIPAVLLPSVRALAASYRETQPDQEIPTLLVGLGARSTTLVLLEKNSFQARSLSLGGFGVTQQIAEARSCDLAHAEELKLSSLPAGEIASFTRLFASRLGQEIARTLGHFHRPITAENPLRVMLTGGGAGLEGLSAMLAVQLGVPVTIFSPANAIELGREAGDFSGDKHRAFLADIVGAAALQLRAGQSSLNLLPTRLRQQEGRRRLRPWLALAAGLAVAGSVPLVVHQHKILITAQARNAALERELAPLRIADTRYQDQRRRVAEAQRLRNVWLKITDARTEWLRLLAEIETKFMPGGDVWLDRMQVIASSAESQAAMPAARSPLRIGFSGLMKAKIDPVQGTDTQSYQRLRNLLETIATAAPIAAVENESFESAPSGLLRFNFVIVLREPATL